MSYCSTQLDVIVVNFHGEPLIERTIAIARSSPARRGPDRVDNSPGDGAAEVVGSADPANVIVDSVNRGYAAAVAEAVGVGDNRADAIDRTRIHLTMRAPRPS